MKCGAINTSCMARSGDICMEHLITDTPSCPSRVPLTNADRIRAMSDEELEAFILRVEIKATKHALDTNWEGGHPLDWLKQEVKA